MNYTAPDKVDNDQWSPIEHNEMKSAINSKLDTSALINDPNATPSSTTFFSTSAINNIIGTPSDAFKKRDNLVANSDLNLLILPGYHILPHSITPINGTFPVHDAGHTKGGVLVVYVSEKNIVQEFTFNGNNLDTAPRVFKRCNVSNPIAFEGWYEMATVDYVDTLNPTAVPDGAPTINAGSGIVVTPYNCKDKSGQVTILNSSGVTLVAGSNIVITFQYARPEATVLMLQNIFGAGLFEIYSYNLSSTAAHVRIMEDIPDGDGFSFYYLIS